MGTLLGTCVRIPHEVLKQRLQCGQYTNVNAALMGTVKAEGVPGLFRGSIATLGREVREFLDKLIERCSDGVEDQRATEAVWGLQRIVSSVLEAVSRASSSPFVASHPRLSP